MSVTLKSILLAATASVALPVAAHAQAQAATPPVEAATATDPQPAAPSGEIAEIVVTAQRRAQSVQTVPIAITAVTGAELEQRSATNITDIVTKAPGVEVTT